MWQGQTFFNEDLLIEDLLGLRPALAVPSPALVTPLPFLNNVSPNKLATKVPNSNDKKPPRCY